MQMHVASVISSMSSFPVAASQGRGSTILEKISLSRYSCELLRWTGLDPRGSPSQRLVNAFYATKGPLRQSISRFSPFFAKGLTVTGTSPEHPGMSPVTGSPKVRGKVV